MLHERGFDAVSAPVLTVPTHFHMRIGLAATDDGWPQIAKIVAAIGVILDFCMQLFREDRGDEFEISPEHGRCARHVVLLQLAVNLLPDLAERHNIEFVAPDTPDILSETDVKIGRFRSASPRSRFI
jgi:hypothetical protein